jgi:hypothetical protein
MFKLITASTLLLLTAAAAPPSAATFTGLFNTGVDANNVALTGGAGQVDAHYSILSSTRTGFAGQQAVTYFNGAYVPEDGDSRWISLDANGLPGNDVSTFRLSFTLTGANLATARVTGRFGSDNGSRLLLNGQDTGFFAQFQFLSLTSFSVSGLKAGLNTLDFEVTNQGGPTALRVDDLVGFADAAPGVPEPASWAMMIAGFGLAGAAARRRLVARARFV